LSYQVLLYFTLTIFTALLLSKADHLLQSCSSLIVKNYSNSHLVLSDRVFIAVE